MIKHLGSGATYKTYDKVDPTLLESVPRSLNRAQYDIKFPFWFAGNDVWNCYEFSCLIEGFPVTGVLKLVYGAGSDRIIESKSLKLYLNSFNMANFESEDVVVEQISNDLKGHLGAVQLHLHLQEEEVATPIEEQFFDLQAYKKWVNLHDKEYPEILKLDHKISLGNPPLLYTNLLRSNCRVTGQPDWADCYLYMNPASYHPRYILEYLLSFRNENHFHEEVCEMIYKRLWDEYDPQDLFVACLYTRRGGIDINPVRASSVRLIDKYAPCLVRPQILTTKSMRH